MLIKNCRAFTLLETLSSVAIFTVIFLLIFGIFASGNRLWLVTDANASNQNEARRAIMEMEKKIRGCTDFLISDVEPGQSSVSFNLNGETIIYELVEEEDYPEKYHIVEITYPDGMEMKRRIANDIASLKFTLVNEPENYKYDKVEIDIVVRKTTLTGEDVEFTLKQIVMLRNS